MTVLLKTWIRDNEEKLKKDGITVDNINISDVSITVDQSTHRNLGRISLWDTGLIDLEVLTIETEESLLYEHHEIDKDVDFVRLLANYFSILNS